MASEIRVDKITSLSGVGTITPSSSGIDITGITTVATLKATTGIVTTLTATTGIVTTLTANTVTSLGAISGTTGTFSGDVDIADKIVHTGDTNTAIRFPAADTITAETGGVEALRISSSTAVIVAGTSAYSDGTFGEAKLQFNAKTGNHIGACSVADTNNSITHVLFKNPTGAIASVGTHNSDFIALTGNTERLRISSAGIIQCGTSGVLKAEINNAVNGHQFISQCDDNENGFEVYQKHGNTASRNTLAVYDNRGSSGAKQLSFAVIGDGNVSVPYGNVKMGSGYGIDFSATGDGSGTMTSELLDDYEEGTFTVTLPNNGSGNQTVTNNPAGRYTKIGGFVYIYIYAIFSGAPQNNTDGWQLGGLPYATGSSGFTHHGMGQIQYTVANNYSVWRPLVASNSRIYFHRTDGSSSSLLNQDVVSLGMTYFLMGASYMSVN